mgnify:CR=1 FL=1
MKKLALFFALLAACVPLLAESPRFTGLALGVYGTGGYMLGDWADIARADAGGGIALEATLVRLGAVDFGASGRAEAARVFPNDDGLLERETDFCATAGVFLRIPFGHFAFQPEIAYGALVHAANGKTGARTDGVYCDQIVRASAGLRFVPPFAPRLEIEFAPVYSFSPEESHLLHKAGGRLGGVWHFSAAK